MKFIKTSLADAMLIDIRKLADDRGYFARTFCAEEFGKAGLETRFPQSNHSHNRQGRHAPGHAFPARAARRGEGGALRAGARSTT